MLNTGLSQKQHWEIHQWCRQPTELSKVVFEDYICRELKITDITVSLHLLQCFILTLWSLSLSTVILCTPHRQLQCLQASQLSINSFKRYGQREREKERERERERERGREREREVTHILQFNRCLEGKLNCMVSMPLEHSTHLHYSICGLTSSTTVLQQALWRWSSTELICMHTCPTISLPWWKFHWLCGNVTQILSPK